MTVLFGLKELSNAYPRPIATIGNFDGIHRGHQRLILDLVERAAKIGGTPTVITFNPHPLRVLVPDNAPRQIQTLEQKLIGIEALGAKLAIVIPFDLELARMSARDFAVKVLFEKFHLQEIYVGPNFAFGHRREGSFNLLKEIGEERGILVAKIHQEQFRGCRISSTAIRQALISGQVALACRLLGRPFAIGGTIVHGEGIGEEMNIPTANIRTPNELTPRNGVYLTRMMIDGKPYRGLTNIGTRPTITGADEDAPRSIETHVLDFRGDIYGKKVVLEFLLHLRGEKRFSGIPALAAQIQKDIARAYRYFRHFEEKSAGPK
jgi:riboflavin kinase / FMN adenylyltransferase